MIQISRLICAVYANATSKSCMVCYLVFSDVSANEQSQLLFTSESFLSTSQASHWTKGIIDFIKYGRGKLTMFKSTRKENHTGNRKVSILALPNVVLKWICYFIIIVTPFQFECIIIPIILC